MSPIVAQAGKHVNVAKCRTLTGVCEAGGDPIIMEYHTLVLAGAGAAILSRWCWLVLALVLAGGAAVLSRWSLALCAGWCWRWCWLVVRRSYHAGAGAGWRWCWCWLVLAGAGWCWRWCWLVVRRSYHAGAGAGWCWLVRLSTCNPITYSPTKYRRRSRLVRAQPEHNKKPLASCDANGWSFLRRRKNYDRNSTNNSIR